MAAQRFSLETIEDFLAQKRNAMVGISREPRSFSVMLFDELFSLRLRHRSGKSHPPPMYKAGTASLACKTSDLLSMLLFLMTSPAVTDTVVCDCAAAGILRVWMYRATDSGFLSEDP